MLTHPWGIEGKKRLLKHLTVNDTASCLHALFPELRIAGEAAGTVKPFSLEESEWGLTRGDLSSRWIAEAEAELRQKGLWEAAVTAHEREEPVPSVFVLEEMSDSQRAGAFLVKHYYRYAMFPWFWQAFAEVKERRSFVLQGLATEIACFDGAAPWTMEHLFDELMSWQTTDEGRQRLWHKLGVLFTFRESFDEAERYMARAWGMLPSSSGAERICREAEWHNGVALIELRRGDYQRADIVLTKAEQRLAECPSDYERVAQIAHILRANRVRLRGILEGPLVTEGGRTG
ncbi:MAG TPA: hypothetical protein VFV52_11055 [Bacilli bacterium]|nr:hypothetical protein [Bacilli bacterium]